MMVRSVLTLSTLTILFCPTLAAYWYESVAGNGLAPYVGTPSNYLIYRNVVSLGADKTGQNDVTSIFQNAINREAMMFIIGQLTIW